MHPFAKFFSGFRRDAHRNSCSIISGIRGRRHGFWRRQMCADYRGRPEAV
jgi:hypothetical protein